MSLLSIIVPVYNTEIYLEECLASLASQTLKDIEIICVNDGSTDNSLSILMKYAEKDSRIKVINLSKNSGLSYARNVGISQARSPYITFVDSDDTVKAEAYSNAIRNFSSGIDLVCFGIEVVGDDYLSHRANDDEYYRIKYLGVLDITQETIFNTDVSACNKIFKKSVIDKYAINFPEGMIYEDACFYFNYIAVSSKIAYLKEKYYQYKRRKGSTMGDTFDKKNDKAIHHLLITKNIFSFYVASNVFVKHKETFARIFESYFWLSLTHVSPQSKAIVFNVATNIVEELNLDRIYPYNTFVQNLKKRRYSKIDQNHVSLHEKFFSIRKIDGYKVVYLCGLKLRFKNRLQRKIDGLRLEMMRHYEEHREKTRDDLDKIRREVKDLEEQYKAHKGK